MTAFGPTAAALFKELAGSPNDVSETLEYCRVDNASCKDLLRVRRARELARAAQAEGFGEVEFFGAFRGKIDLEKVADADVGDEPVSLVLKKASGAGFTYFVTVEAFGTSLRGGDLTDNPQAVWVSVEFEGFATEQLTISPWGGPRVHEPASFVAETPRKFVRDLTGGTVPERVDPWLLRGGSPAASAIFAVWREVAAQRLALALPSEVRATPTGTQVVLKGPRSAPIQIAPTRANWEAHVFPSLADAARWVYGTPRETETKFQFLNNHLSLDWRDGNSWPNGLETVMAGSLTSAREAFAFYLQDQSKEAVKSLGDLRKSLQEEVAKAQSATRDLMGGLWRDFGIAGVVLALKSPTWPQISTTEALRWITVATAVVLSISLLVTTFSNWRFNRLADVGRREWRGKLYAFLSEADWQRLVEVPIARARRLYRVTLVIVWVMYAMAVYYLLVVAVPEWIALHVDPTLTAIWQKLALIWSATIGRT